APAGAASAPAANDRAMIPIGTTPMSLTTTTANTPAIDPMLDETKRILSDYISLLSANKILIANQPK
ncbi:MAG TPA: hypothetical protein VMB80_06405, partial [Candidatus Acidoferrum sp.]|nr:hypothetical protein [Candidatus Acidoferrum sp.]